MTGFTDGVGFPIKATDQFSAAFDNLMGKTREADQAFDKLVNVGGRLGGVLGALGIGAGLAGFTAMIKGAIDSADAIDELSQKTGIAVKELSQWDYVLKREGVSSEAFGKSIKDLSKNMIEATDATSQSAKIFKTLGIDIKNGPDKAMEDLADAFAALPDGATKATLATTLFGKAGMDLIPMLNMGKAGIQDLKREADRLGLTLTAETAAAAAKFNDDMAALQGKTRALSMSLMTELMPSLSDITGAMKEAAQESGVLTALWVGLGGLGDLVFNGTKIKQARNEVEAWDQQIAMLTEQLTNGQLSREQFDKFFQDITPKISKARAELDALTGKGPKAQADAWAFGPSRDTQQSAQRKKELDALIAGGDAAKKAADEAEKLRQQGIQGWVRYADAIFAEADEANKAIAKSNEEFWKNEDKLREQGIKGWLDYIDAQIEAEEKAMREIADMQPSWLQSQEAKWKPFMEGLDSGFRQTWDRIVDGGISSFGDFFKSIGESFKRMLADLVYQAALKPIFLNVVGGLGNMIPGLGGLTGAASSALGNGQTAGFGGLGSIFSGIGSLFKPGASAGGFLGGLGSILPAVGAGVALVSLIRGFLDKGENPNLTISQGTGGAGLFGGLGFGGNFTGFNADALRGVTGGLDSRFLRLLGGNESGGTAALAAYTAAGRRTDGQPAQFAFPEGDQTAAEQIAKELLQSRYGTLFGLIDKSFAEQIKSFAGTSTELQAFIEAALGLFESLDGTKVKGLNIDSLRAMQRQGEELGATMDRVANDMASINSLFIDETDAFVQALGFVQSEFDALGVDMAINADSFKTLRDSLDLSTESGRAMFEMLVRVAPAMQQIEQAAAQMLSSFNGAMGQIFGSGFTRQIIEGQAAGLVSRFQGMTGLFGGMDPLSVFRGIGGANSGDIQYLYQTGGPELQSVLTEILQLYSQYVGLQEQVNTNTGNFSQAVTYASNAFDQLADARGGLRKWLDGLFLNDALTPLSPMQQLEESRRQYEQMLGLAQGGNVDAVAGLGNSAQTYLQIARDLFASSPAFNDIFRSVTTAVGGVAGVSSGDINARLATALPSNGTLATSADIQENTAATRQLIMLIANGINASDPQIQQTLRDIQTTLNKGTAGALV